MEAAAPMEPDPASWILVDVQVKSSNENPFEIVESVESPVTVEDDDDEFSEDPSSMGHDTKIGKETPAISKPVAEIERSDKDRSKLEKSVEQIQQSLETLQSESRSNSTEIETIRARLDRLLLKQKLAAKLNITCKGCGMEIARQSDIVSRDFRGQSGPAMLIRCVANVHCGPSTERTLMTGTHVTAWEFCKGCGRKLGWRYLEAMNPDQKYKIGMSCIEAESVSQ